MNSDDHARALHAKLLASCEERAARARALIAWIDGMCLDNMPGLDMEIRAAINRYWEEQK